VNRVTVSSCVYYKYDTANRPRMIMRFTNLTKYSANYFKKVNYARTIMMVVSINIGKNSYYNGKSATYLAYPVAANITLIYCTILNSLGIHNLPIKLEGTIVATSLAPMVLIFASAALGHVSTQYDTLNLVMSGT